MNCIVSVDEDWGIGFNNKLLESIPGDLAFFKEKTLGKVVIMGKNTFNSLPGKKPLSKRKNIVLTNNSEDLKDKGIQSICSSVQDVLSVICPINSDNVFVIGGEQIFKQFLHLCDIAYITKIYKKYSADTHMVNLDKSLEWKLAESSDVFENNGTKYQFLTYKRIN